MQHAISLPTSLRPAPILAAVALLLVLAVAVWAQVGGERGIAPVAASSDIEVSGVEVDVRGKTGEEAREKGWAEAARKAWAKIDGPDLPDSQIQQLVSAIVIERERLGPRRYIATLGVVFDRPRASRYLGTEGPMERSAPMLLIPVTISAGSNLVYETRNPWQRAWAEFQSGSSQIDYVRPSGAGGDSLLITYGQTSRRSRIWWRNVLDQFGAADVLIPIARLRYTYPGGPVEGEFTARYGPDNRRLASFSLTAANPGEVPAMLERAVRQFDSIYQEAFAEGKLRPDSTLNLGAPEIDPAIARLLELGRAMQSQEGAASDVEPDAAPAEGTASPPPTQAPAAAVGSFVVQFATPDGSSFDATIRAVRAAPGVRGTAISSTAIGGTSVMRVTFAGSLDELAAALRARGFTVRQGSNALAISR